MEDIVAPLLQHNQIQNLYIIQGDQLIEHIEQKEVNLFAAPPKEDKIALVEHEDTYETNLELVKINLKEGGKWRVRDIENDNEFNVSIDDEQFNVRVQQSKSVLQSKTNFELDCASALGNVKMGKNARNILKLSNIARFLNLQIYSSFSN